MAKFCSNCGKPLKENQDMCLNCGVMLNKKNNKNGNFDANMVPIIVIIAVVGIFIFYFLSVFFRILLYTM